MLAAVARSAKWGFPCLVVRYARRTRPGGSQSKRAPSEGEALQRATRSSYVYTASWCCSVGTTWTVELRSVDEAALGRLVEWIGSGVPTQQPAPEYQTADLLRERELLLYPVDPANPPPRTRSRRLIGYVTRDPEVLRLARMITNIVDESRDHPMVVAARWIQAGYSAEAATRWITAGVNWPRVAQTMQSSAPRLGSRPQHPG
jgi:hypothetical protein